MISADTYPRYLRPLAMLLGMAGYVLFTWNLQQQGHLQMASQVYLLAIPVWVFGFAVTLLRSDLLTRFDDERVVLFRALWCNLGAVLLAVLVVDNLRLLLLTIPLFSVLYAAVHLPRQQVLWVVLSTLALYAVGVVALSGATTVNMRFELCSGLIFGTLMCGVLVLARDIQDKHDDLLARNRSLREVIDRLQEMAHRDELTGLHNRRSIMEILARQKGLVDRGNQAFSLCYADIDHFKSINDRFGHAVGDVALRQFAQLAGGVVRSVDFVARFGGEEFLMILVHASEDSAQQVAARLTERARGMRIPGTAEDFMLTVSVGIARYRPGERIDHVLMRADDALYEAKRTGRDRIVVAH